MRDYTDQAFTSKGASNEFWPGQFGSRAMLQMKVKLRLLTVLLNHVGVTTVEAA
jgi:hypothetical protein